LSGERATYEAGAELTAKMIREWRGGQLRFAFPPREVALLADLRDIGHRLARNDAARELVNQLIERCVEATGQAPTAMMLRVILEMEGHAIDWRPLSEFAQGVGQA
jgi:hypothetical protein